MAITLHENIYEDWYDYINKKFCNNDLFSLQLNFEIGYRIYKITSRDKSINTEIVLGTKRNELKQIYFTNPNSPQLTKYNNENSHPLDLGYEFDSENLNMIEEKLNIPLKYGWKERTIFFKGKEFKSETEWKQYNQLVVQEIEQKNKFMLMIERASDDIFFSIIFFPIIVFCMTFAIIPFYYQEWERQSIISKIKSNPNDVTDKKSEIQPMIRG